MEQLIGIDIGGTQIKYAVVSPTGDISTQGALPTQSQLGAEGLIKQLLTLIATLRQDHPQVRGIGISTAGQVNSQDGSIMFACDAIQNYSGTPLKAQLTAATGLPVWVENDVNCALLGEQWRGAAQDQRHAVMLTVGTNIGGAILIDGRLLTGRQFAAGECGLMTVNGRLFQEIASTRALIQRVAKATGQTLDGAQIFAQRHHSALIDAEIAAYLEDLASGICNVIALLDPEVVIIGGGISVNDDFIALLRQHVQQHMPLGLPMPPLVPAALGNQAGFMGAVRFFLQRQDELR